MGRVFGVGKTSGRHRHPVRTVMWWSVDGWPAVAYCGARLVGPATGRNVMLCAKCEAALIAEERAEREGADVGAVGV